MLLRWEYAKWQKKVLRVSIILPTSNDIWSNWLPHTNYSLPRKKTSNVSICRPTENRGYNFPDFRRKLFENYWHQVKVAFIKQEKNYCLFTLLHLRRFLFHLLRLSINSCLFPSYITKITASGWDLSKEMRWSKKGWGALKLGNGERCR